MVCLRIAWSAAGYLNGQSAMPREWSVTVKHNF